VDVVVAPLACSDSSLLSQKPSLQRVCENLVCTEDGSLNNGLGLVNIVCDENEAVSGPVTVHSLVSRTGNQRVSQHLSRSKYYIYQTFLDHCVHLLPSGKFCRELSRNYGTILQKGLLDFSRREHDGIKKNFLCDYTQPLVSSESQYVMQRALSPFIVCRVRCECH
jgi:hypothetical protein